MGETKQLSPFTEAGVPHQFKAGKEQVALATKAGQVCSDRKKYSAQLRELKKRVKKGQLKSGDEEWLLARVLDPNASALNIISLLDEVKADELSMDPDTKVKLANAYSQAHKIVHGQKIRTDNTNLNININVDDETNQVYDLIRGRNKE